MKIFMGICCFLVCSAAQAQDFFQGEIHSQIFVKINFDGHRLASRDDSLKLGFRIDQKFHAGEPPVGWIFHPITLNRRPLVDVEFSSRTGYFSKFTVGGVDTLLYRTIMHANGETSLEPYAFDIAQVAIGAGIIAGAGYGIYVLAGGGGNDEAAPPPVVEPD
jgi:hypothetical protein